MPAMFWFSVILACVVGAAASFVLVRHAVRRISARSAHARRVRQAGNTAAAVASLPALFFAMVLGVPLGASMAIRIAQSLASGDAVLQVLTGIGIGVGVSGVMVMTIVATAVAGAVFMKVYLAR